MRKFQYDVAELLGQRRIEERNGADPVELAAIDRKIGDRINHEKETDEYFSVADIARRLGDSPAAVESAIWGHGYRGMEPDEEARLLEMYIVVLDGPAAARFVTTQQARVVRSISGFDESDAALRSNLYPAVFTVEDRLDPPNMLWQLDSGEWVGVSHTQVGYGGEGPRLASAALIAAGVAEDLAEEISRHRFCDAVDITNPQTWETSRMWPVEGRSWPLLVNGRLVVAWGPGMPGRGYSDLPRMNQRDPDPSGFYPSSHATPGWEQWIDFLDQEDLPDWAEQPIGPRRSAWLFYDETQAEEHGFQLEGRELGRGHFASPTVVLTQGVVQLWAFHPRPAEAGRLIHEDTIKFLKRAGLPTEHIEREERRRTTWWSRLWRSVAGNRVPEPMFVEPDIV